jgi:hypothetical protein
MPEIVKDDDLPFESFASESDYEIQPSTKERYLMMALTSLLAVNLVVVFGALTFYYLLVRR